MVRLPRRSALVPYTSLFRSGVGQVAAQIAGDLGGIAAPEVGLDGAAVGEGARAHDQESAAVVAAAAVDLCEGDVAGVGDGKSRRLNCSHTMTEYAVFRLQIK